MIDLHSSLVLPLMYHLMQQGMNRFVPSIAPNMPSTDDDLRLMPRLSAPRVVTEPGLHPAGNTNRNSCQLTAELHCVQIRMLPGELSCKALIGRLSSIGVTSRTAGRVSMGRNFPLEQSAPCVGPIPPRASVDESHDRRKNFIRCVQIPTMNSELTIGEAHQNSAVLRQPNGIMRGEAQPHQRSSKVFRCARARIELRRQLKLPRPDTDQSFERSKQR